MSSQFFANVPLFAGMSAEKLQAVDQLAVGRSFPRGRLIFSQGDSADGMYLVQSGRVKVFLAQEDGDEVILGLLGPGDYFGEMALIDAEARSSAAMAHQDCELSFIAKRDFRRLLRESPELAQSLLQGLSERLRMANGMIASLATEDVTGRLVRVLLQYGEIDQERLVVAEPFTQQDMARMVGASREMVNRSLQELARQGVIEHGSDRIVLKGLADAIGS
ncbi:Crp/Fnr family transcriptional regulator [Thiohalorhabdus sp.]|uniref:Crp/Fnr family transcriptional regulator n=1 Tax=Thiohalorhabdus sp. TaxID=3094134 RepID=UPI002FC29EB3